MNALLRCSQQKSNSNLAYRMRFNTTFAALLAILLLPLANQPGTVGQRNHFALQLNPLQHAAGKQPYLGVLFD